jgi:hypothetical protein
MEVLTVGSFREVLPVFSYKEEAELFLRLEGWETGWRVRDSTCGELVSVLYAPCRKVRRVALDPLPEMTFESTIRFVSLSREAFIKALLPSDPMPSTVEEPRMTGVVAS